MAFGPSLGYNKARALIFLHTQPNARILVAQESMRNGNETKSLSEMGRARMFKGYSVDSFLLSSAGIRIISRLLGLGEKVEYSDFVMIEFGRIGVDGMNLEGGNIRLLRKKSALSPTAVPRC